MTILQRNFPHYITARFWNSGLV